MAETYHSIRDVSVPSTIDPWSFMELLTERVDFTLRALYPIVRHDPTSGKSTDGSSFARKSYAAVKDALSDHGLVLHWLAERWFAGVPNQPIRISVDLDLFVAELPNKPHRLHVRFLTKSKLEADRLGVEFEKVLTHVAGLKRWKGATFKVEPEERTSTFDEAAPAPSLPPGTLGTVGRRSLWKYISDLWRRYFAQLIVGIAIAVVAGLGVLLIWQLVFAPLFAAAHG